jgi:acetolactate synthase-1/2/3 large subunit
VIIAERIALWLRDKGITHAMGVIGGGNVVLWDAITRLGATKLISTHHEQAAVMAANAYYQVSRQIAVALVTTGAGSTNAITGAMAAYMDSVPVLVISGNEASKYMNAMTRVWGVQGYDSALVAHPFCKSVTRLMNAQSIGIMDSLYDLALAPRQGTVWIDIPKDVQNAPV